MRDWIDDHPAEVGITVCLLILGALFWAAWYFDSWRTIPIQQGPAIVISRVYTPSSTSTGVAPVVTSNGQGGSSTGMAVVMTHEDEKYLLEVQIGNAYGFAETTASMYHHAKPGDVITATYKISRDGESLQVLKVKP